MGWVGAAGSASEQLTLAGIEAYITGGPMALTYTGGFTTDMFIKKDYSRYYYASGGQISSFDLTDPSVKHVYGNTTIFSAGQSPNYDIEFFQISDDGTKVFYKESADSNSYHVRTLSTAWDVSSMSGSITETWTHSSGSSYFNVIDNGRYITKLNASGWMEKWELSSPWSFSGAPTGIQSQNLTIYYQASTALTSWTFDDSGKSLFLGTQKGSSTHIASVTRVNLADPFDLQTDSASAEGAYSLGQGTRQSLSINVSPDNSSLQVLTHKTYGSQKFIHDFKLDADGPYNTGPCRINSWTNINYNNGEAWNVPTRASLQDGNNTYLANYTTFTSDWLNGVNSEIISLDIPAGVSWNKVQTHISPVSWLTDSSGGSITVITRTIMNGVESPGNTSLFMSDSISGWHETGPISSFGWSSAQILSGLSSPSNLGLKFAIYPGNDFDSAKMGLDCMEIGFEYTLP